VTGKPHRAETVVRVAAMAIVTLNIWTGGPLLALWIGSRVQGSGPPTMSAVFLVVVCLAAIVLALVRLLAVLSAAHERATGHQSVRRHVPWLRSMRGERERYAGDPIRLTALDRTLVVVVVIAVAVFEVWFFFFSASPIDQRSGRGQAPAQTRSV
jgi:MFS family permease